jgi:hypothetical protein
MRLRVSGLFFVLGALLVACGGGGKSGVLPNATQPNGGGTLPAQATKQLAVVLKFPPANQQSHARKPFFVSANTQSIVFAVVPNGSGTPTPAQEQTFPVATPSPCATTAAGGETCSFSVAAPYGTDIFYVATFAVPSPNASSSPLASFVSGAIAIGSPVSRYAVTAGLYDERHRRERGDYRPEPRPEQHPEHTSLFGRRCGDAHSARHHAVRRERRGDSQRRISRAGHPRRYTGWGRRRSDTQRDVHRCAELCDAQSDRRRVVRIRFG